MVELRLVAQVHYVLKQKEEAAMNSILRSITLGALAIMTLSSCAAKLVPIDTKSYTVGSEIETAIGNPMISVEDQEVVNGTRWVGVAFSPTGYEQRISKFRKELIYGGKSGSTINVAYREYANDMARAPFSQALRYDLNESKTISFQNFKLAVLEANNSIIKFRVISD